MPDLPTLLTELERLEAAATKGPWRAEEMEHDDDTPDHGYNLAPKVFTIDTGGDFLALPKANAALIVSARNALPRLLALARAAEGMRDAAPEPECQDCKMTFLHGVCERERDGESRWWCWACWSKRIRDALPVPDEAHDLAAQLAGFISGSPNIPKAYRTEMFRKAVRLCDLVRPTVVRSAPSPVPSPAPEGVDALVERIRKKADDAYCDFIGRCRQPLCLGWEAKVRCGEFTQANLDAHRKAHERYGAHLGLHEARSAIESWARGKGKWTRERPQEPGWYWLTSGPTTWLYFVDPWNGVYVQHNGDYATRVQKPDGEWSGPILPPKGAPRAG